MSHLVIEDLVSKFKQKLLVQRYAQNTIKTYGNCLTKFLTVFQKYQLETVNEKNIENYIIHLLEKEKISDAYQKQLLGTIGKFFEFFYDKSSTCMRSTPSVKRPHSQSTLVSRK